MGTRHLICVVRNGEFKVAQYGQWDGYLSGQGQDVLDFLLKRCNPERFRQQVDRVHHISEPEYEALWKAAGADGGPTVSMDVAEKFKRENFHLHRDCGAKILDYIQDAEHPVCQLSTDFAGDSLMCEWAYVIDLDTDTLEVYKGFNKEPVPSGERFADFPKEKDTSDYYPIRLARIFKLSELRPDTMSGLEKEIYPSENEG